MSNGNVCVVLCCVMCLCPCWCSKFADDDDDDDDNAGCIVCVLGGVVAFFHCLDHVVDEYFVYVAHAVRVAVAECLLDRFEKGPAQLVQMRLLDAARPMLGAELLHVLVRLVGVVELGHTRVDRLHHHGRMVDQYLTLQQGGVLLVLELIEVLLQFSVRLKHP